MIALFVVFVSDEQISPPSLVYERHSSNLHSVHGYSVCMGVLSNSTGLRIPLCKTLKIYNFKKRRDGEIRSCDVKMRMGLLENIQFHCYCFCLRTKMALNWVARTLSLHKGVRPKRRLYTKNITRGFWLTQRTRMTIKRITTNTKPPRETNCHNSHSRKNTPVSSVASLLVVVTDWLESVSCVGEGDEEDSWAVTVGDGTMLLWFWFACNRSGKTGMITWRWSQ